MRISDWSSDVCSSDLARMRKLILAGGALLAAASVTALLAQTVNGLDLEAVRKRSAEMQDEAVAFVEQVKDRGDAFREDAASVRVGGMQNMERVAPAVLPRGTAGPTDFEDRQSVVWAKGAGDSVDT